VADDDKQFLIIKLWPIMIIYLCVSTSTSNRVCLDYQTQLGNLRMSSEATTTTANTAPSSTITAGYSSSTSPPAASSRPRVPADYTVVHFLCLARTFDGVVYSLYGAHNPIFLNACECQCRRSHIFITSRLVREFFKFFTNLLFSKKI
jgi:hypothetical protein